MKKIKFLGAAILAASLIFAGCANGSDDDVDSTPDTEKVVDEKGGEGSEENGGSESGSGEEAGGEENSGEDQNSGSGESSGSGDSGSSSGGESSGSGDSEDAGDSDDGEDDDATIPDTGVYWEYLVGAPEGAINALKGFQDWGNGSKYTNNNDGSITVTSGTTWGEPRVNLAYGDIPAGYFTRFDRVIAFVDESDFEATSAVILFAGSGDDPITVTPIEKDGLSVYVADISDSSKAAISNQIALQLFGTGSVTVKSWYFEADSEIEVFKTPLTDLIAAANELKENVTVGTDGGNYPEDAYDAFVAAIETAQAVEESNDATQVAIYEAYTALVEAKSVFAATKIPDFSFSALSGVEIPEDAIVLFKADDASNSLLTPNNKPWYLPDGGSFTIKVDDYSETAKIYEIVTKGDNACGCFDLNVQVTAGQKLYVSCYSEKNTSIKPVAPDAETLITGSNEWQLIEVEYSEGALLHQLGVVGKTAEENSLFIDAVYIK